jgi:hypothetical protein
LCSHKYLRQKTRKLHLFFPEGILTYAFDTISRMYPQKPIMYAMKIA